MKTKTEVLKMLGINATKTPWGTWDFDNPYIGMGVSLTQENGAIMLSLSGWWADLKSAQEHLIALQKGVSILEALQDTNDVV